MLLFVITFVFLYISTDVITDFNFYPRINKQYIHTYIISYIKSFVPGGTLFHRFVKE